MGKPRFTLIVKHSLDTRPDAIGALLQERLDACATIKVDDAIRITVESGRTKENALRRHLQAFSLAERTIGHKGTRRDVDLTGHKIYGSGKLG
jgi:hypothetical protein